MDLITFNHASATSEPEYEMVSFGDAVDGSDDYILFQLSNTIDAQERDLGMGGVYLEFNDQAHGEYDALRGIDIQGNTITLHISPGLLGLSERADPWRLEVLPLPSEVCDALAAMMARSGIPFRHALS